MFGFVGWAYESLYYSIMEKKLISSGFLNGCICPIYGIGGLMLSLLPGRIENPIQLFFTGMIITSALEYAVSVLMERIFHERWWDYSTWPLNIHGRVSIISGMAFGILSVIGVKYIIPETFSTVEALTDHVVHITAIVIAVLMLVDIILTVKNADSFTDKLWYVREQSKLFEEGGTGYRLMRAVRGQFAGEDDENGIIERIKRRLRR